MIHRALDFRFALHADEPLARALLTALEPLVEPADDQTGQAVAIRVGESEGSWTIESQGHLQRLSSPGRALAATLEYINRRAASSLERHVPLHAAAVQLPERDDVVALVGSSGAGKSTLGTAAVQRGWGFLAEEIAAVDTDTLETLAFHRPVGLRSGGAAALGIDYPNDREGLFAEVYPWPVPVSNRVASGRLQFAALIDRSATNTSLSELRPAEALSLLVEHSVVPDDARVVPVFRQLESLVRRIPVVGLGYTSLDEAVALLAEFADRSS